MINIIHQVNYWYWIGSIFPILSVIICWICFYSLNHHTPKAILTISETVLMNIEAYILFVLIYIRNSIAIKFSKTNSKSELFSTKLILILMKILWIICPIGLILVSAFTLDESLYVHLTGAGLFFIGMVIYNIISDLILIRFTSSIKPFPIWSTIITWSSLGFAILYGGFGISKKRSFLNLCAIFQYLTALSIFVKVAVYWYDVPKHYFTVNKKD